MGNDNDKIRKALCYSVYSDGIEYARKVASAHVDYSKCEAKQREQFEDFFSLCLLAYLRGSGTELTAVQAFRPQSCAYGLPRRLNEPID